LGGRVSLIADIELSEEKSVSVNNVHLEAGTLEDFTLGIYTRYQQTKEIA